MKPRILNTWMMPIVSALCLVIAMATPTLANDTARVGKAVPFAWTFTPIDVGIEVGTFAKQGLALQVTGFAGDA